MATEIVLFDGVPAGAFAATPAALLIAGERLTLDFDHVVGAPGAPASLEWFMEFTTDDPRLAAARWAREVAEEDVGGGVTHMPPVVRDFSAIAAGTTRFDAQFVRAHRYVRLQLRTAGGAFTRVTVRAIAGVAVI